MTPLMSLIHDINNQTDRIYSHCKNLSEWLKKHGKGISEAGINTSIPFVLVEYFKKVEKDIKEVIDKYYTSQKDADTKYAALQIHADKMAEGLRESVTQIKYLHVKFKETGSGNTVISRSNGLLTDYETFKKK